MNPKFRLNQSLFRTDNLTSRRSLISSAIYFGVATAVPAAFAQGSGAAPAAFPTPAPTPAPSPPVDQRRLKADQEEERLRLEKIRLRDEALAKMPKNQRVLRPKFIEIDGKKVVELDMYGTRFRIPREYLGQITPDGAFIDGYFWGRERLALGNPLAQKLYPPFPIDLKPNSPEGITAARNRGSLLVLFLISARPGPISPAMLVEHQAREAAKYASIIAEGQVVAAIGSEATEIAINGNSWTYIRRNRDDLRTPTGEMHYLRMRSGPPKGDNTIFRNLFYYKGVFAAYDISRRLVPEWKQIHTEVLRLLDEWSKE